MDNGARRKELQAMQCSPRNGRLSHRPWTIGPKAMMNLAAFDDQRGTPAAGVVNMKWNSMAMAAGAVFSVQTLATTAQASNDPEAADLVATQVRDQGFDCGEPVTATREKEEDDDAVWILNCENATYRVRLIPDMAARIEEID